MTKIFYWVHQSNLWLAMLLMTTFVDARSESNPNLSAICCFDVLIIVTRLNCFFFFFKIKILYDKKRNRSIYYSEETLSIDYEFVMGPFVFNRSSFCWLLKISLNLLINEHRTMSSVQLMSRHQVTSVDNNCFNTYYHSNWDETRRKKWTSKREEKVLKRKRHHKVSK